VTFVAWQCVVEAPACPLPHRHRALPTPHPLLHVASHGSPADPSQVPANADDLQNVTDAGVDSIIFIMQNRTRSTTDKVHRKTTSGAEKTRVVFLMRLIALVRQMSHHLRHTHDS